MKPSRILIFSLLFVSIFARAQGHNRAQTNNGSITIELSTYDHQDSRGFLILYPLSNLEDSIRNRLDYPDFSDMQDTAYAEIYFTGNNCNALQNNVMVMIGNFSTRTPEIWIDHDNDLNLSEKNDRIKFKDDSIEVSIPDINGRGLHHSIRLYKPDSAKYQRTDSMLTKHITKGEHVAFYYDQRLNIQAGDFIYKGDSIRFGVMDYNVNGSYDDINIDRIVFGTYKREIDGTDKASGALVLDETTFFKYEQQGYKIDHIEANGSSIRISPMDHLNVTDKVEEGDTISNYTFDLVNGKETSIKALLDGKNYLYLNFWASWCAGCHMEMKSLEKVAASDSIKVVSLNYKEDPSSIHEFVKKYNPQWKQGRTTGEINEDLMIEGLPRNLLLAPNGRIIEMDIHPSRLPEKYK